MTCRTELIGCGCGHLSKAGDGEVAICRLCAVCISSSSLSTAMPDCPEPAIIMSHRECIIQKHRCLYIHVFNRVFCEVNHL